MKDIEYIFLNTDRRRGFFNRMEPGEVSADAWLALKHIEYIFLKTNRRSSFFNRMEPDKASAEEWKTASLARFS